VSGNLTLFAPATAVVSNYIGLNNDPIPEVDTIAKQLQTVTCEV